MHDDETGPYEEDFPDHVAEVMGFHEIEIDTPKHGRVKIDVPSKTEQCAIDD